MDKEKTLSPENILKFVSDFGINFEWVVCVDKAPKSLSIIKKIVATLRAYKVLVVTDTLSVDENFEESISKKILEWGIANDLGIIHADALFLQSLLSDKALQSSSFVTSHLLGSYLPGKKILTIPRGISNAVFLEKISEFDFVFSSEKKDQPCWGKISSAAVKFLVGLEKKLPKKLAKKACELIVGGGVVMERGN